MGPATRRSIAVVGAGRAGGALALSLHAAGWPSGLVGRSHSGRGRAQALGLAWLGVSDAPEAWLPGADAIVLAVRDGALAPLAASLARTSGWQGKVALHLSGSLSSEVLAPLRGAGAVLGSLHPLISLAARPDGLPTPVPDRTPFFGEGEPGAMLLARDLAESIGGRFEELSTSDKPLYHAGATIAGNLAAVLHAAGAGALGLAGLSQPERALLPLVRASVDAVAAHGGIGGLTGPLSRGDVETLEANIMALRRTSASLRRAHAASSLLALDLLRDKGCAPEREPEIRALLLAALAEIDAGG